MSAVLLPAGSAARGTIDPPAPQPVTFEQYEFGVGSGKHQSVVPGFFLGGATAEIVVLRIDESGDRRLRMYGLDGGAWALVLEAKLGRGVRFVDVATIDGRDRLITYESGRLNWFDPGSATERTLAEVTTSYNATPEGLRYANAFTPSDEGELPHVDITRDLNRDGRDDLVLPDVDGFWVIVQKSDGAFAEPVKLGPPEPFRDRVAFDTNRPYGEVGISPLTLPWYLSRVHEFDYNRDGRIDLVFWNRDHFEVHLQDARGLFSPAAETFEVDAPFEADGTYTLMFGYEGEGMLSLLFGFRKSSDRTVLYALRDMDGDNVADLVTLTHSGRSLIRQRTRYEVHFGTPTPDGVRFASEPGVSIRSRAKAPLYYSFQWLRDVDGDGTVDILHGHVKTGVLGMVRALLRTSVSLGLEVYRSDEGVYADRPATTRRFKADIVFDKRRDAGFFPAVLVGDVNGDGRTDVLAGRSREELHVFLGVPGPKLLAREPQKVAVAVPGDERNSWLVDLNRDGKEDVLMHLASAVEPDRLTMLITR